MSAALHAPISSHYQSLQPSACKSLSISSCVNLYSFSCALAAMHPALPSPFHLCRLREPLYLLVSPLPDPPLTLVARLFSRLATFSRTIAVLLAACGDPCVAVVLDELKHALIFAFGLAVESRCYLLQPPSAMNHFQLDFLMQYKYFTLLWHEVLFFDQHS